MVKDKEKILVLGGTGFLGKHVCVLLEKKKYSFVSLSRREGCDIRDVSRFKNRLRGIMPTIVINCAAHVGSVHYAMRNSAEMISDNMLIITNIYRAIAEICPGSKIINPISNCSYPGNANIHSESDWENGPVHDSVLAFASTRRMIYAFASCYKKQYGVNSVNWIISNAYGPGDYVDPDKVHALNGIIIRMLRAKKNSDKTFEIWGSGKPTREWVYIKDVAKILVQSIGIKEQIYPLNFAQKKAYSIKRIAKIASEVMDYSPKFVFNLKFPDGAPTKLLDNREFRAKYPDYEFEDIKIGIKKTADYYLKILG